jgi:radical SAM protein with 4Fe4S-binding SPASM domain
MTASPLGYGAFSAGIHAQARARRLPVNATIELTHRCPLNCSHCYNNLPVGDAEARRGELSTDELRRIIDELADAGGLWVLFTGGEIFARQDFLEIYTHAKRRGLLVTLFTNGTQITPAIADYLVEWPPFSIEITLYGHTRETYERLTRVPGSHARCRRGIQLLRERGLPLKLKTVAVTINRHEIADMERWARDQGIEFKFDGMINARVDDCSGSPLETRLLPREMVELDLEDPARAAGWAQLVRGHEGSLPMPSGTPGQIYHCGGGISSFAIDPEGKMSICVLSQQEMFDLREGSFQQGWNEFLAKVRTKPATRHTKCSDCRIRELCSNCAATAELEHGDAETPVDYFCEVAHLRSHALGFTPPAHGACAFCAGGSEHARLLEDAAAIKRGAPVSRRPSLHVVQSGQIDDEGAPVRSGCGSGGCGSCGAATEEGDS